MKRSISPFSLQTMSEEEAYNLQGSKENDHAKKITVSKRIKSRNWIDDVIDAQSSPVPKINSCEGVNKEHHIHPDFVRKTNSLRLPS